MRTHARVHSRLNPFPNDVKDSGVQALKSFLLKVGAKRVIDLSVAVIGRTPLGRVVSEQMSFDSMRRTRTIEHRGLELIFAVPNAIARYRADSFSTKEPETLDWIDSLPEGATFWDIGANVGLYSVYAAKRRHCRVFAFEPSVFNTELLARNVALNGLTDLVTIIPLPLAEKLSVSKLNMTSTQWGGAMSTFGAAYGHDGRPLEKIFEFQTIGLSMSDAVNLLGIPQPDFIKMDVDGIEHLIVKGGAPVLERIEGMLIEINDDFVAQADEASSYLRAAGLSLEDKKHADCFDSESSQAKHTYNQIWIKA
jgi:FkbM family methyltransferase